VVDAAAAVVDRDGIDGLTMRRVAEELDSSPMALYRHVRDKDELLVALLDRLVERLPRPDLPEDPRDRILVAFGVIHDGLAASPWVVGLLAAGDLMAPSMAWLIEEIHAGLVACGLPAERAVAAYRALWQFTIGELTIRDAGRASSHAPIGRPCRPRREPRWTPRCSPPWPRSPTTGRRRGVGTPTPRTSPRSWMA
jgi:AcrR family transcriptional regulator